MTQNILAEYESSNAPLLRKLCTTLDQGHNRTKFLKMEKLKLPRQMLTNTWFVTQDLLVEQESLNTPLVQVS